MEWKHTGCGSAGGNATADEGGTVLWLPSEDLSMLKGPLLLPYLSLFTWRGGKSLSQFPLIIHSH